MLEPVIEGALKHREGKKWKSRWAVLKKASPVADCLTLCLYKDVRESRKGGSGKEKASVSLKHYLGLESGFQLDKETHVLALLCGTHVVLLAFHRRDLLIDWQLKLHELLGQERSFPGVLIGAPASAKLTQGPIRLFVHRQTLCLVAHIPPQILLSWLLSDLRRFGAVENDKFALEGGQKCGRGFGQFVFLTDYGEEINYCLIRQSDSNACFPERNDPLRAPTIPRRPSLALAPTPNERASQTNNLVSRQHSAPQGVLARVEGCSQGEGQEAYCDDAWLRIRHQRSNSDDLVLNQSHTIIPEREYENPESSSSLVQNRSNGTTPKKKHRLPIFHRHSRSTDHATSKPKHKGVISTVSPPIASTNTSLPVAHAYSRSADDLDGESDFMDLSAYLWHTRKEGSASTRYIEWKERILRKSYQDIIDPPTYGNTLPRTKRYENQDAIDAHLKFQQLSAQQHSHLHQNCAKSSESILSPGASSSNSNSLSPHSFHCSMNLLDEVLKEVSDKQLGNSSSCSISPTDKSALSYSPFSTKDVSNLSNGKPGFALGNKSVKKSANELKSESATSIKTSDAIESKKPQQSNNIDNRVNEDCLNTGLIAISDQNQTILRASPAVCSSRLFVEIPKDSDLSCVGGISKLALGAGESGSGRSVHANSSSLCQNAQAALQPSDCTPKVTSENQLVANSSAKLISPQSLPNVSLGPLCVPTTHLIDSVPASRMSSFSQACVTQANNVGVTHSSPRSSQASVSQTAQDAQRPLEFVDLSKFDGVDEGYLYWMKGASNNSNIDQQSTRAVQRGYDNVPMQNGVNYENVTSELRSTTRYDNVNYDIPTRLSHNYDNIRPTNRAASVMSSRENVNTTECRQTCHRASAISQPAHSHQSAAADLQLGRQTMYCNTGVAAGGGPPATTPARGGGTTSSGKPPVAATIPKTRTSPKHSGWSGLSFHGSLKRSKKKSPRSVTNPPSAGNSRTGYNQHGAGSYVRLRTNAQVETSASSSLCTIPVETVDAPQSHTSSALLFVDYNDPQRDNLVNSITEQQLLSTGGKHSPHGKQTKQAEVANLMPASRDTNLSRTSGFRILEKPANSLRTATSDCASYKDNAHGRTNAHVPDFVMVKASTYNKHKKDKTSKPKSESHVQAVAKLDNTKLPTKFDIQSSNPLQTKVPLTHSRDSHLHSNGPVDLMSIPPSPQPRVPYTRECEYIDMSNPYVAKAVKAGMNDSTCSEDSTYLLAPAIPPKLPPKPALTPASSFSYRSSSNSSLASNNSATSSVHSSAHNSPVKGKIAPSLNKVIPVSTAANTQMEYVEYNRPDMYSRAVPELHRVNSAPAQSTCYAPATHINHPVPVPTTSSQASPYMDMTFMLGAKTFPKSAPKSHGSHTKLCSSKSLDTTLDGEEDDPYLHMGALGAGHSSDNSTTTSQITTSTNSSSGHSHCENSDEYLPMKSVSRQSSVASFITSTASTIHEDIEKPADPFNLLDIVHHEKQQSNFNTSPCKTDSEKQSSISSCKSDVKCDESELLKPFDLLDLELYEKSNSKRDRISPSKLDNKSDKSASSQEENPPTPPVTRKSGKSQGLFARLMRRNSSAKELSKISKSQEDILDSDLSSQIPPSVSPTKSKKEPIYAQIPEVKSSLPPEPYTMPLKKKQFKRLSSSESLLDPDVKNERNRLLNITVVTNRAWLEHGNLTDEQKQSCASLLSNRSMTPPTPPPTLPLPPPPLPPRPGRASLSSAPPVPPKTYLQNTPSEIRADKKSEPEYADIDENGVYHIPRRRNSGPTSTNNQHISEPSDMRTIGNDSVNIVEYTPKSREQATGSFFRFESRDGAASKPGEESDYVNNPPPRPPRVVTNYSHTTTPDQSQATDGSRDHEEEAEEDIWEERNFPRVKAKPGGRFRSLSLRSARNSLSSDTASLTSQLSFTEPSSPFRTIDTQAVTSPAATVLRPRAGKEYQVIDRRRLLGDEAPSSGNSSGCQTPVSLQSSPSKSPGATGSCVFNFDPLVVESHRRSVILSPTATATTENPAENPRVSANTMGTKAAFRGGDPDPIYMNLTFPNALSRPSGSPIIIDSRRSVQPSPDYANVVLNYAEIDLSHNRKVSGSNTHERPLASSNAMTEYSVIDMVATMAASQAAKDHVQSREDSVALKQRKRHSDVSKRHSDVKRSDGSSESAAATKENSKRKERKGVNAPSARGFLSRSHSAVSRTSTLSARDRKASLSGSTQS